MRSDLFVGPDVSLDQTSVCVVDESGVAHIGLECVQLCSTN